MQRCEGDAGRSKRAKASLKSVFAEIQKGFENLGLTDSELLTKDFKVGNDVFNTQEVEACNKESKGAWNHPTNG